MSGFRSSQVEGDGQIVFESLRKPTKRRRASSVSSKSQCSEASNDLLQRSIRSLQQRTHHCNFDAEDDEPEVFLHRNTRPKTHESLRRRLTESADKRQELRREVERQRELKAREECPFAPTKVSKWSRELPYELERSRHECQRQEPTDLMNSKSRAIVQRLAKKGIWERQSQSYRRAASQMCNRPEIRKHSKVAAERLYKGGLKPQDAKECEPEPTHTSHKTRKEIKESTKRLFQSSIASKKPKEEKETKQPVLKRRKPADLNRMDNELKQYVATVDRREREAEYRRQYQEIQDLAECRYAPKETCSDASGVPRDLDAILKRRSMYKPSEAVDRYSYRKPIVTHKFSFDNAQC